ncbi:MAG: hypothetical protein SF172_15150 [Burkholderiales bacterium]|nr:hypothetical protein [Burkholderiales bacterium]
MARSLALVIHDHHAPQYWRREVITQIAEHNIVPYIFSFGKIAALQLALPWLRPRMLTQFRQSFDEIHRQSSVERPSILCQGIGTWLVTQLLLQEPTLKVDKLVLIDPDVAPDYPWTALLQAGRFNSLRIEEKGFHRIAESNPGSLDQYVVSGEAVPEQSDFIPGQRATEAGRLAQAVRNSQLPYERWSAYLARPSFSEEDKAILQKVSNAASAKLAAHFGLHTGAVDVATYLDDKNGELVLLKISTELGEPAGWAARIGVDVAASVIAESFRENRTVLAPLIPAQNGFLAPSALSAAAPLRAPGDGRVMGVLAVSTKQVPGETDSLKFKACLMSAASKMATALVNRSTGY